MTNNIRRLVPLPFQGNKANHIQPFIEAIYSLPDDLIFVDLFGGSLYLSYVVHQLKPKARIISNDYDNFRERLNNIEITNQILDAIRLVNPNKPTNSKFTELEREQIRNILTEFDGESALDILTLSNALCFSSMRATNINQLLSRHYYNRIPHKNYDVQWYKNALEGIEFVREDWQKLFERFKENEKVCFITDPPYINSDQSGYAHKKWSFNDSLKTLKIFKHPHFIYFTSEKTNLFPIVEFIKDEFQPISYTCHIIQRKPANNRSRSWNDLIIYR